MKYLLFLLSLLSTGTIFSQTYDEFLQIGLDYQRKDPQRALEALDKAIALEPNYTITYSIKATILRNQQDYRGAIDEISKAINIEPQNPNLYIERSEYKSTFAVQLKLESKPYFDMYAEKINDLTKAIEFDDPKTYNNYYEGYWSNKLYCFYERAEVKRELNDYRGAISDYSECIKLDPNNSLFYYHKAQSKESLKDFSGAIADLTEAILRHPKQGLNIKNEYSQKYKYYNLMDAYGCRAKLKWQLNDLRGAISDYDKIIEVYDSEINNYNILHPYWDKSMAYFERGFVKIKLGRKDEGCLDLSTAGELGMKSAYYYIKEYCK